MNEQHYVPGMTGCSDGGCIFHHKAPGMMVTNGGCQCQKELQRTEQGIKAIRTIWFLRNQLTAIDLTPKGYCVMGDNCLCGGDVPAVREGCFEWKAQ